MMFSVNGQLLCRMAVDIIAISWVSWLLEAFCCFQITLGDIDVILKEIYCQYKFLNRYFFKQAKAFEIKVLDQ